MLGAEVCVDERACTNVCWRQSRVEDGVDVGARWSGVGEEVGQARSAEASLW